jgi:hexosaminidase
LSIKLASVEQLLPRPRRIRRLPGAYHLHGTLQPGEIHKQQVLRSRCPQWYSLRIQPQGIRLQAVDEPGFRYGLLTLGQLIGNGRSQIPAMEIEDWPDFSVRGVMLDVSRDKVPTMSTLKRLIDMLAGWKINQLQLYTEHTFAYAGHERVWRGASPLTPTQIEELDRCCRQHCVELVPNQNSFGHMERWLRHEPYARLAEASGPWKTPWGDYRDTRTTLNPLDRGSIRLVSSLYDQLLPCFSSTLLNVGCDETWELGQGRSGPACRRRGVGRVYLDFLLKIYREVKRRRHRMMFWADIAFQHSELIAELPSDVIPMVWGYEADHPFDRQCATLAKRGVEFYVCPGTSSWCSFGGRTRNCLDNLRNAAAAGRRHGASGYLITDWGDFGHRQYLPVGYAGFLYGAAVSWCGETNATIDAAREVSRQVWGDRSGAFGRLWHDVGTIHELSGVTLKNRTILFSCMEAKLGDRVALKGLSLQAVTTMERRIEQLAAKAAGSRFRGGDGALAHEELLATLAVLRHACKRARLMLSPGDQRDTRRQCQWLARDMEKLIARHRQLWLKRNRPGGLASSVAYYRRNLREYDAMLRKPSRWASG